MITPSQALSGQFPIGIDNVPVRTMKDWQARGCNLITRWDLEGHVLPRQWADAAAEFGFKTIRPATNPADDAADGTLIAINLPDEPDLSNHWFGLRPVAGWPTGTKIFETFADAATGRTFDLVGKEQGNPTKLTGATMATTATVYRAKAAALRKLYPDLPIFGNFAGNSVTFGMQEADYISFTSAPDWIASDWYPVDADLVAFPLPAGAERRYGYHFPAKAVGRLAAWSGGKPQFAYISCVNQRLDTKKSATWRWPFPQEIEAQVWAALCTGAAGIIYFSMQQNPWHSDGISDTLNDPNSTAVDRAGAGAIRDWMPKFNARLQSLADFLIKGTRLDISAPYPAGIMSCVWTLPDITAAEPNQLTAVVNTTGAALGGLGPCEVRLTENRPKPAPTPIPVPTPTPTPEPLPPPGAYEAMAKRVAALELRLDDLATTYENAAEWFKSAAAAARKEIPAE